MQALLGLLDPTNRSVWLCSEEYHSVRFVRSDTTQIVARACVRVRESLVVLPREVSGVPCMPRAGELELARKFEALRIVGSPLLHVIFRDPPGGVLQNVHIRAKLPL